MGTEHWVQLTQAEPQMQLATLWDDPSQQHILTQRAYNSVFLLLQLLSDEHFLHQLCSSTSYAWVRQREKTLLFVMKMHFFLKNKQRDQWHLLLEVDIAQCLWWQEDDTQMTPGHLQHHQTAATMLCEPTCKSPDWQICDPLAKFTTRFSVPGHWFYLHTPPLTAPGGILNRVVNWKSHCSLMVSKTPGDPPLLASVDSTTRQRTYK